MNDFVTKVVKFLEDKKAEDIKVLNISKLTSIADWFVIASGNSTTQVKALCDHLEEELSKEGISPRHVEGYNASSWILLDYIDVVVHIFHHETREFYKLERVWNDAEVIEKV